MSEVTDPDSYAEDQESLASQLEEGVKIEAPKEPEVHPDLYKDVEQMIFRGFITVAATVNDVTFVFKSLNQHEMDLLRFMCPDLKETSKFWSLFLAYGIFMIDGINILPERERWIPKIAEKFEEFQLPVRAKIVRHLSEINRRASNAVMLTECYVTEKYSRYRWYQLQGQDMTSTSVTGIPGTSSLGMNWAQLVWRALNQIEDIRDKNEHAWENAKFIGGCMAGKGISKVYQQDATRKNKEKEAQIARKDRLLRKVVLGEKIEGDLEGSGHLKIVAKTTEELAQQLERDLRGEKDWHDLVVEDYEARARAAEEERRKDLAEMARIRDEEFGGKSLLGASDMRGLTPDEVHRRIMSRRNPVERLTQEEPQPIGQTDRDPSMAYPLPNVRRSGTPFKR